ncbi:MAG: peptidoglycan-binding protein [Clostridia bacterium]|nr:peptidoglycan-binding protein [Clostridia bacterium]
MKLFFRRILCALLALSLLASAAALAEEAGYAALSYGMKDTDATAPAVKALQDRLKELGYMDKSVPSTGGFWNATATALSAFQRAAGLTVNGKLASPETQRALFASGAPAKGGSASASQTGGIRQGSRGSNVTAMQRRLIELGYLKDRADGDYGPNTAKAVAAFQQANGLPVNGALASEETLAALNAASAVTPAPTATPTPGGVKYGDRSSQVAAMQRRLIELGYLKDVADGIYGQNTARAVVAFQQANGLTVNGNAASAETLAALNSDGAPAAATATPAPTAAPQTTTSGDTPVSFAALQLHDRGAQVAAMQRRLIELGYLRDVADGIYGQNTAKALAAFQQANGLTVNGNTASAGTLGLLLSTSATPLRQADIRYKERGSRVTDMQRRLIELGYLKGPADGDYGPNTAKAVAAFQQASGLTVNGNLATAEMLTALNSDAAKPASAATPTPTPAPTPAPGTANSDGQIQQADGSYIYAPIQYGARGSVVEEMQLKLLNLGYTEDFPDGQFGPKTGEALAAFQQAAGFPVNKRLASSEVLGLLFSNDAPRFVPAQVPEDTAPSGPIVKPDSYPNLRAGMTNNADVRLMQDRLRQLGYFKGASTGNYFDETAAAVKKFCRAILGASYTKSGQAVGEVELRALYSEGAPTYAQYTARENGADGGSAGTATEGYADLHYGDKGDAVVKAEKQLRAIFGGLGSDPEGEYGVSTVLIVARFQTYFGYPVNGTVLTAQQQKLLFSSGSKARLAEIRRAEGGVINE